VALSSVEAVLEKVWESLHTGSWADASDGMRKLYSHASLLKVSSSCFIYRELKEIKMIYQLPRNLLNLTIVKYILLYFS